MAFLEGVTKGNQLGNTVVPVSLGGDRTGDGVAGLEAVAAQVNEDGAGCVLDVGIVAVDIAHYCGSGKTCLELDGSAAAGSLCRNGGNHLGDGGRTGEFFGVVRQGHNLTLLEGELVVGLGSKTHGGVAAVAAVDTYLNLLRETTGIVGVVDSHLVEVPVTGAGDSGGNTGVGP